MSSLSIPELIISTFARGLETFAHVLAKSDEWAKENGVDPDSFVNQRLVEDQLPLSFQVQFVSRIVQTNLGRLSGETATLWEEDEKTFQELRKRIDRTLDLVKAFDLAKAQATDFGAEFDFSFKGGDHKTTLQGFFLTHVLPNFFFHLSTGYQFLRAKGVPLGKKDWLGGFLGI